MDGKIVKYEIVNVDDGNGKLQDSPGGLKRECSTEKQRALDEG